MINPPVGSVSTEAFLSMGAIIRSLPKFQLSDGINYKGRNAKSPDPHQLIATDLLVKPWLEPVFSDEKRRTRLLVADEGGVGKTISACLFIKKILVTGFENESGKNVSISWRNPIVILIPPGYVIQKQWTSDLEAILSPEEFALVCTGKNNFVNGNAKKSIYILSKHSLSKLFTDHGFSGNDFSEKMERSRNGSFKPALTIIDEIHQGRSSSSDGKENTTLWASQTDLCSLSNYAMGLSATPINLDSQELVRMLKTLGGEAIDYAEQFDNKINSKQIEHWKMTTKILIDCSQQISDGKIPDNSLLSKLSECVMDNNYPCSTDESEKISYFFSEINWTIEEWKMKGPRLLRELHPLGRHLTLVRRADLGEEYCSKKYRTMITDNTILEWGTDLTAWFKEKDMWGEESGGRYKVHSWPWNAGLYEDTKDIEPPRDDLKQKDPRIIKLLKSLEDDRNKRHNSGKKMGAVIFCHWKETVKGLVQYLNNNEEYLVLEATGDDEKNIASVLKRAEKPGIKYPIVICTQVGEVGINMEWATLGIHWDLGENPQSVEQRGWRLDRRLGESISEDFLLIRMLTNHPYHKQQCKKFDQILDKAQRILGLPDDSYVKYTTNDGITSRTWTKGLLFSITDSEMIALESLRSGGGRDKSEILSLGVTAEKIMWLMLQTSEKVPINKDLIMDGIIQITPESDGAISEWYIDDFSELIYNLRKGSLIYPNIEQLSICRLLSPPIHPDRAVDVFECQPLAITNSDADKVDACRSQIRINSSIFKNCLAENGMQNDDMTFVPLDLKELELLPNNSRGQIHLVNFNPNQKQLESPSWLNGSLWLANSRETMRPLELTSDNDLELLNEIINQIAKVLCYPVLGCEVGETQLFPRRIAKLEKTVLELANQNSSKNKRFIRKLKNHFDSNKNAEKGWPGLQVQCIVEL